tara:strand:+ start:19 stop:195 length:177 start_codon:yes stop_codon:yes gene_type:complete
MSYKKELLNMSRRLDQVQLKENPPDLKMVVADENKGESLPEVEDRDPWSLYLKIEQKA